MGWERRQELFEVPPNWWGIYYFFPFVFPGLISRQPHTQKWAPGCRQREPRRRSLVLAWGMGKENPNTQRMQKSSFLFPPSSDPSPQAIVWQWQQCWQHEPEGAKTLKEGNLLVWLVTLWSQHDGRNSHCFLFLCAWLLFVPRCKYNRWKHAIELGT